MELLEVEFFTTPDASGTSENCCITAITVNSSYPGFPASDAIDGNTLTTWSTADNSASNSWIAVDFIAFIGLSTRTTRAMAIYPRDTRISPTTYLEASSDNSTWTRVATLSPASTQVRQVFANFQQSSNKQEKKRCSPLLPLCPAASSGQISTEPPP
ncbi:hypothetical protein J2847_002685 [Azospirillum agricola]|uniref:discoidin domain-containing protein n=1 Tax=Azospirillum agricola TaxID=1720247 RepID=UPI001AEB8244|nr:discoidin domain-containing protein [Azospirillum agricola]MBP2229386.1 hypothetical protein [Azospirillum agricola]